MSNLSITQKISIVGEDDAVALLAPGRKPLTYKGLRQQVSYAKQQLSDRGIGTGARIALVLPNGPEMAMAFLSVTSGMCAAPINPSLQTKELEFSLADIGAAAVIVASDLDSPVWDVASRLRIPVVSLKPKLDSEAGLFELSGEKVGSPQEIREPKSKDVAVLLHTSGTTALPKLVPLTQGNIAASVENVVLSLELHPSDRCLQVMPMFHIHGLIASLLSSLSSGGSVVCTPGFNAFLFSPWVNEFRPTWYSAVPSMHHGILSCLSRFPGNPLECKFRFVRSSSAALPTSIHRQLEEVFRAPVIEAYGMTEASHQIVSCRVSSETHRPGFVGNSKGTEVAIVDGKGKQLLPGNRGEIVIKGRNIMKGYVNNSKANAESYFGKWFRTGDEGVLDETGCLTLTGRIKEIINRGGEKVSPLEIDLVIQEHPAVEQAATFGFQHDDVGEEIGVLIVMKKGQKETDENIKKFVSERLAPFKVPRKIVFVQDIPKSPTGKIARRELGDKFGLE